MSVEHCLNVECNQQFEVIEFGNKRPAQPEPRKLVCPYCGHAIYRKTRGAFIVSQLENDSFASG